jgi:uncharacterized protein (DUF58 family)
MIVPRNRLIFWSGIVLIPCSLAGVLFQTTAAYAVGIVALFFLLVIMDAISASNCLSGIEVKLPELVRLSKDREGAIELSFMNNNSGTKLIRVGLPLPAEISSPSEDFIAALPNGAQNSLLKLICTPKKRGRYSINTCHIEGSSSLGLWAMRSSAAVRSEIRVYPSLLSEQKNLAALFLSRGVSGLHSQRQVGQGREFEKLREYIHGDSYDSIHWKATAKRGKPVTKIFQVERTQDVYIIIDSSRLSARSIKTDPRIVGSSALRAEEILDRFVSGALVMGIAAERQGDRFGLLGFSDRVNTFMRAKNGRTHFNACRDILYNMTPDRVNPDFDEMCSFICNRLRRRSLLVFLTNLDDPVIADSFTRNMVMVRRKHLVLVNMLKPVGVQPVFSGPDPHSIDDIYAHLGGHLVWQNIQELSQTLKQRGIGFSLLKSEKMCNQLVSQYITVKKRQLL